MEERYRQMLTKAFPFASHKWRVLNTSKKNDKATWYVYVDARDVAERLDSTGLDWSDEYEVITMTDKLCVVQCRLTIGSSTRSDVGSDSKSPIDNEGNYIKGAYSDALKRAAVKFGVGRYLYAMTSYYLPIDEFKHFTPESLTKIKAHLSKELKTFGATGSVEDLRSEDEEVELPLQTTQPASKPTNGNGHKSQPAAVALPFTPTHEAAVDWGFEQGCFNAMKHAQNAYKELARLHGWTAKEDSKIETKELFRLWVVEVKNRVSEKNPQDGQPQGDPVPDLASMENVAF